jgi:hypothetical protein
MWRDDGTNSQTVSDKSFGLLAASLCKNTEETLRKILNDSIDQCSDQSKKERVADYDAETSPKMCCSGSTRGKLDHGRGIFTAPLDYCTLPVSWLLRGCLFSKRTPGKSPNNNISSKESGLEQGRPLSFRAYALDIFYELKPSTDVMLA